MNLGQIGNSEPSDHSEILSGRVNVVGHQEDIEIAKARVAFWQRVVSNLEREYR